MANKNNSFGKFLAFATTIAAIGGACYVFRDQIKQSPLYKISIGKLSGLFHKVTVQMDADNEDDFFFEDETDDSNDTFVENTKQNREYTSITTNPKEQSESSEQESNTTAESAASPTESSNQADAGTDYENEGLSDTSEDPDVLEEQDKLDY